MKTREKKSDFVETLDVDDSIIGDGPKPRVSVQKKKKVSPLKPLWRNKDAAQVGSETLERFALQLQNRQTLRHIQNEDPYNTLGDKTVQMHK